MKNETKQTSKESFLLYKSFYEPIKDFTNEDLGILTRTIFEYQINPDNPLGILPPHIKMAFEFFKNQFRLDDIKYKETVEINRANAIKRWEKERAKDATASDRIRPVANRAKHADKEKGNDKGNENENGNDSNTSHSEVPPVIPVKTEYGNHQINEVISYFKEKLSGSLDGTIGQNRQFANHLLKRIEKDYPSVDKVAAIKQLIDIATESQFHSKNATSFMYLYRNMQKVIMESKKSKSTLAII